MAARDRNLFAWQAYVMTTSIISVGLLVGVFLLWRSYSDLSKRSAEMATQLAAANSETSKWDLRVKRLKSMLGYGTHTADDINFMKEQLKDDADMAEVEKNYATDMTVFGPNDEKKDYRQFPISLLNTIRERNTQIAAARQLEQRLTKEKSDVVDRETKAREQAVKEKDQAVADLATTRQQHAQQLTQLNAEKDQIQGLVNKFKQDLEAKNAQIDAERNRLASESKKQQQTIDTQVERITSLLKEDFEEPSGTVINVAQGARQVWINIGSDDGLREGVSFVVLDESTLNVAEAKIKAEMVVEKVIAPHMAMARVTSQNFADPVLPGDVVYSPAWRKGRTVGFALVGLMDINGDGRDDRDSVRSVIENSGGRVDAQILPNGTQEGEMDANTVKVVIGTDVKVGDNASNEQKERAQRYAKFIGEARLLGINQMNLSNLMGYLKSKDDTRTVPLGSQTNAADFAPKSNGGLTPTTEGVVSELFRQRRPAGK